MEKNGFTLIELIITIGLLAILGTMIASNMLGVQSKQMESNYESYKEQIADAACLVMDSKYIGTGGIVYIDSAFTSLTDSKNYSDIQLFDSSEKSLLNNIVYENVKKVDK